MLPAGDLIPLIFLALLYALFQWVRYKIENWTFNRKLKRGEIPGVKPKPVEATASRKRVTHLVKSVLKGIVSILFLMTAFGGVVHLGELGQEISPLLGLLGVIGGLVGITFGPLIMILEAEKKGRKSTTSS